MYGNLDVVPSCQAGTITPAEIHFLKKEKAKVYRSNISNCLEPPVREKEKLVVLMLLKLLSKSMQS